jgi:hypothetical protein
MAAKGSVLIGAAGETYILYQLFNRDLLAAPAPTGAPIADLIVFDPKLSVGSMVQVKTTTVSGRWVLGAKNELPEFVHPRLFYAFVDLVPAIPEVYIVPSVRVADFLAASHTAFLARGGKDNPVRSIRRHHGSEVPGYLDDWLDQYRDRWDYLQAEPPRSDDSGLA